MAGFRQTTLFERADQSHQAIGLFQALTIICRGARRIILPFGQLVREPKMHATR